MSGIVGIYNLDGRPVDPALLKRMTDEISHRGPDGVGHWIDGPVGLGHQMLCTTPESLREKQPLLDETGNLCLTLDGRVDNRDELKSAIEAKGGRLRDDTDAELVLKSYECWGESCPNRIIGDFAFAIWDKRKRQLFCARDFLGLKPFYYVNTGRSFLFSSELPPIFIDSAVQRYPNEGMIAEYLANAITSQEETLFQNVFRLPPAHYLLLRPGTFRKQRYWTINPGPEICYKSDEDYAKHFLEIFREAVCCRLRSNTPVGVSLSGGLDSSSVAGVAASLVEEASCVSEIEAFSTVYPGYACDESDYINDVIGKWRLKWHTTLQYIGDLSLYSERTQRYQDFPGYPNGGAVGSVNRLVQKKGVRVLLSGVGGDEWLTGSRYRLADHLQRLRAPELVRELGYMFHAEGMAVTLSRLLHYGLWPLLPRSVRSMVKWVLGKEDRQPSPSWIESGFAAQTRLAERMERREMLPSPLGIAPWDIYVAATNGFVVHAIEMEEREAARYGLEGRHPLLDRRVVEFALALPEEQRCRCNQNKFVLRQVSKGYLPETVNQRRTKADFSHLFAETFQTLGAERLWDSLSLVSQGWVAEKNVQRMYQEMTQLYNKGEDFRHIWPLWMIFGVELWFNTIFLNMQALPGQSIPLKKSLATQAV